MPKNKTVPKRYIRKAIKSKMEEEEDKISVLFTDPCEKFDNHLHPE